MRYLENTSHYFLRCQRFTIQCHRLLNEIEAIYQQHDVDQIHRRFDESILGENQEISRSANHKILAAVLCYIKDTQRF